MAPSHPKRRTREQGLQSTWPPKGLQIAVPVPVARSIPLPMLGMIGLSWLPSSNGRKANLMTYCNHLTLSLVRQPGNTMQPYYIFWKGVGQSGGLADRKPKRVELSWAESGKQTKNNFEGNWLKFCSVASSFAHCEENIVTKFDI